jgi:hypothetical protein
MRGTHAKVPVSTKRFRVCACGTGIASTCVAKKTGSEVIGLHAARVTTTWGQIQKRPPIGVGVREGVCSADAVCAVANQKFRVCVMCAIDTHFSRALGAFANQADLGAARVGAAMGRVRLACHVHRRREKREKKIQKA